MLLIAGGHKDPNIQWLLKQANNLGVPTQLLLTKKKYSPAISWDLENNELCINGKAAKIQAAFVRRDVFHKPGDAGIFRALNWYSSICGWLACTPEIKILNRDYLGSFTNKPQTLFLAKKLGLRIPETLISNQLVEIGKQKKYKKVAKPVSGGGYCQEIDDLLKNTDLKNGFTACPAIIQQKISGPDLRVYRIGEQNFGFRIEADALDYRQTNKRRITYLENLQIPEITKLGDLMDNMDLNWGAADFKYDTKTDQYYFLEVNSNPMFSVFDRICDEVLTSAMIRYLIQ